MHVNITLGANVFEIDELDGVNESVASIFSVWVNAQQGDDPEALSRAVASLKNSNDTLEDAVVAATPDL